MITPNVGKWVLGVGVVIVLVGIVIYFAGNRLKWVGHLPGDIRIDREHFKFYFPITTMILLSLLLNAIIRIFKYFF